MPVIFLITPPAPLTPNPLIVIFSGTVIAVASPIFKELPLYIVVVPAVVPNALLLVITFNIPAAGVPTVPIKILPV